MAQIFPLREEMDDQLHIYIKNSLMQVLSLDRVERWNVSVQFGRIGSGSSQKRIISFKTKVYGSN